MAKKGFDPFEQYAGLKESQEQRARRLRESIPQVARTMENKKRSKGVKVTRGFKSQSRANGRGGGFDD